MDYDDFYTLVASVDGLTLPSYHVAEAWGDVAREWQEAGVIVQRIGIMELTDGIKAKTEAVGDLQISDNPYSWLARLFQLSAETNDQNARGMVNGLLPDQHGQFRNTIKEYLYSDGGIPEEVKDIASELDFDLRSKLLNHKMDQALAMPEFKLGKKLVHSLLDKTNSGNYTEAEAVKNVLGELAAQLTDESQFNDNNRALHASARMIVYLAKDTDIQRMRQCPLLTASERITYISRGQQILAPVQLWPENMRAYSRLYVAGRLLSDRYGDDDTLSDALQVLITKGIAISTPLYNGRRATLDDVNLLREMSHSEGDMEGVTVRDGEFGQIAFLATDVIQRCGQDRDLARLLADFVLNVAAHADQGWISWMSVSGTRSGEQVSLRLRKSIWPFELKVRPWIPVRDHDRDTTVAMPANEANLRELLDQSWLSDNRDAVDLLHEVFGFRRLTLLLDRLEPEVEDNLVELVQSPDLLKAATDNPDTVRFASELEGSDVSLELVKEFVRDMGDDDKLTEILENRRVQLQRIRANHDLGANVESLVKANLEDAGFTVCRTGTGSDFEIADETGDLVEWSVSKDDASWLVEVKATRNQQVRMTDIQAKEAVKQGNRFLLCVVPVGSDEIGAAMPEILFVSGLGERLAGLCEDIDDFEERREDITGVTDDGIQLEISPGPTRVRVRSSIWEDEGFPLDELAARLSAMPF